MALVILKDQRSVKVTKEQGHSMWAILQGEQEATPEQEAFANSIDKIYLNFNNAPESYIKANLEAFKTWCKKDWNVDYSGKPTKPQNAEQWNIAKQYGLV